MSLGSRLEPPHRSVDVEPGHQRHDVRPHAMHLVFHAGRAHEERVHIGEALPLQAELAAGHGAVHGDVLVLRRERPAIGGAPFEILAEHLQHARAVGIALAHGRRRHQRVIGDAQRGLGGVGDAAVPFVAIDRLHEIADPVGDAARGQHVDAVRLDDRIHDEIGQPGGAGRRSLVEADLAGKRRHAERFRASRRLAGDVGLALEDALIPLVPKHRLHAAASLVLTRAQSRHRPAAGTQQSVEVNFKADDA